SRTSIIGNGSQAMTTNKENGWRALAIRFGIVKERKAELAGEDAGHVFGEDDDVGLTRSSRVVLIVFAGFVAFLLWAWLADLDEVSTGTGRVVPTMREQVIQSLEGGILADLKVRQDDIVEPGQILARLDPTMTESNVDETAAKYREALASSARLTAEVNGTS